ncbi:hypothetical protein AM571_CH01767 [Rhizobium etli 8C-3]|uniref:Arc-like DNA binding domain-containing protein n=1 Tax=Rhizobium etli 8C-3 TaxID=538025 RepID=A0A1L5P386_RHIET|nr:Arc family DNA-binding protein [Rhizobium etli]APO74588.1 hypothetical protein AM571_CH01767 [Rhizobium etli 8C-3]
MTENRAKSDQYLLRLPPGLRDALKESADIHARSLNAEIVERLEQYPRLHRLQGDISYLKMENKRLSAELAAAKDAMTEQKKVSAMLQHLIHTRSEEAHEEEKTVSAIENRFTELKEQAAYLEKLKSELLHSAHRSSEPKISDIPLSSELFDKLFGDMRDRLDRIERKVDGRSGSED